MVPSHMSHFYRKVLLILQILISMPQTLFCLSNLFRVHETQQEFIFTVYFYLKKMLDRKIVPRITHITTKLINPTFLASYSFSNYKCKYHQQYFHIPQLHFLMFYLTFFPKYFPKRLNNSHQSKTKSASRIGKIK